MEGFPFPLQKRFEKIATPQETTYPPPVKEILLSSMFGACAALPLLVGAWVALSWKFPDWAVGTVSAFGAGALISAIAYELAQDASEHADAGILAAALAARAVTYFAGSRFLQSRGKAGGKSSRGLALLMGAALDGIPESFILGISVIAGAGISLPFLVAVVVSNFPEGMASAAELKGNPNYTAKHILGMWAVVVCLSAVAAAVGAFTGVRFPQVGPISQAFAAGALLTMLIDDLIPESRERAGLGAGLAATLGFAVAFALHQLG